MEVVKSLTFAYNWMYYKKFAFREYGDIARLFSFDQNDVNFLCRQKRLKSYCLNIISGRFVSRAEFTHSVSDRNRADH